MIRIEDKSKCCGCEACAQVCTTNCISMKRDEEGFLYPEIDTGKCIDCGFCELVCPFNKDVIINPLIEAQKCKAKNKIDRDKSSNGGAFSCLARKIIGDGGVVFGVRMSEDCKESFLCKAENEDELEYLLGSKYVQGRVNTAYIEAESEIKSGRRVLFSGTPCQINGLKLYLRQDYDNLYCVDVVCHGVPSPSLWKRYAEYVENKNRSNLKSVQFKFWDEAQKSYGIKGELENGKTVFKSENYDLYMQLFKRNISLRPSCYNCQSKDLRLSDITLGEFIDDNIDRKDSLVFVRTQKGQELLESVKDNLKSEIIPIEKAINDYSNANDEVKIIPQRASFFGDLAELNFSEIEKKYIYTDSKSKIKKHFHTLFKK